MITTIDTVLPYSEIDDIIINSKGRKSQMITNIDTDLPYSEIADIFINSKVMKCYCRRSCHCKREIPPKSELVSIIKSIIEDDLTDVEDNLTDAETKEKEGQPVDLTIQQIKFGFIMELYDEYHLIPKYEDVLTLINFTQLNKAKLSSRDGYNYLYAYGRDFSISLALVNSLNFDVVNASDKDGNYLLHNALDLDDQLILFLVSKGADVNVKNRIGETPLYILTVHYITQTIQDNDEGTQDIFYRKFKLLFEHGARPDLAPNQPLKTYYFPFSLGIYAENILLTTKFPSTPAELIVEFKKYGYDNYLDIAILFLKYSTNKQM